MRTHDTWHCIQMYAKDEINDPVKFKYYDLRYPPSVEEGEDFEKEYGVKSIKELVKGEEIFYWRKHPNLHGWMQRVYEQKGGTEFQWGSFSGPVELSLEDIDQLEKEVNEDLSPVLLTVNALSPPRPRTRFARPRFALSRSDWAIHFPTQTPVGWFHARSLHLIRTIGSEYLS